MYSAASLQDRFQFLMTVGGVVSNLEMIKYKFKLLQEIKALESDILQDDDYVKIYYLVDDAIRNKGSFTLITRPYISELSILS